jgi:arabinose-5-phosphate isomerase
MEPHKTGDRLTMNTTTPDGTREMIILRARKVLEIEAEAIQALQGKIDDRFIKAVELLDKCRGKVIVIGIGKSGLVSQKIASTFACTGTPAFFLHPAEGIHGDIGRNARDHSAATTHQTVGNNTHCHDG